MEYVECETLFPNIKITILDFHDDLSLHLHTRSQRCEQSQCFVIVLIIIYCYKHTLIGFPIRRCARLIILSLRAFARSSNTELNLVRLSAILTSLQVSELEFQQTLAICLWIKRVEYII